MCSGVDQRRDAWGRRLVERSRPFGVQLSRATVTIVQPRATAPRAAPATRAGRSGNLTTTPRRRARPCARGCSRRRTRRRRSRRTTRSGMWVLSRTRRSPDRGPSAQRPCASSCAMGMPSRSATRATSMRPSVSGSSDGSGTHTSSRHAPSGLISQPVASANSSAVRSRRSSVTPKRYRLSTVLRMSSGTESWSPSPSKQSSLPL